MIIIVYIISIYLLLVHIIYTFFVLENLNFCSPLSCEEEKIYKMLATTVIQGLTVAKQVA